nr:hypothetical protein [Tanacetum cinerariifolium]
MNLSLYEYVFILMKLCALLTRSLDPDGVVGSEKIGPNWYEVDVQVAIKKDEYLVRKYGLFVTVLDSIDVQVAIKKDEYLVRKYGLFVTVLDSIGAPVAWPCSFVSVVREDD